MSCLKKSSLTDWGRVKRDATSNAPVGYNPDTDLYDPNDPAQVATFFASVKVVRKSGQTESGKNQDSENRDGFSLFASLISLLAVNAINGYCPFSQLVVR